MPNNAVPKDRMRLLLQLLPHAYGEESLALKGGTAINAFLRGLPRLSVDIDLAYVSFARRGQALEDISACLRNIRKKAGAEMPDAVFVESGSKGKLFVKQAGADVRIEVNQIIRGTVFAPRQASLHDSARQAFSLPGYRARILDPDEIYAGKLVAMLDRRNSRDLFDVYNLLADEGIQERMLDAFVIYLSSGKRPMHELLNPANSMAIGETAYRDILKMMTGKPVSRHDLEQAGIQARKIILGQMEERHRNFLLGIAQGSPDWSLVGGGNVQDLPALKWKLINVEKMDAQKRKDQLEALRAILEGA